MQLSVVILNYKVPFCLMLCLQSVTKALRNVESEIIVVDNHSEDQGLTWVKRCFPEVLTLPLSKNEGFSKANNQGVLLARGKYICLLNPDTVVSEPFFEQLLLFAGKHKNFGALGGKMIDGAGNFLPESKRNIPKPSVALRKLFNFDKSYYAAAGEGENVAVEILTGACMFMLKKRYAEVGGLDEDYFMYGEDIDLSYKLLKAGYQNYYLGKTTLLHFKGESTIKNKIYKKRFYGAMKIFYQKHFYRNRFNRGLVNLGLKAAEWCKNPIGNEEQKEFQAYYWLGKPHDLPKKLELKVGKPFVPVLPDRFLTEKKEQAWFLFNTETMPFDKIFEVMQVQKNRRNCFRFKPVNFNFILGSDQSTTKGKVIEY